MVLTGSIDANNGVKDEIDDGEGKERDDETDDCVKNGIFSIGDFLTITTRKNIAETSINEHNNRDETNNKKNCVSDTAKDTIIANQLSWHTLSTGSICTFLNRNGGSKNATG